ncbi:MAG: acyltransferase [Rhizobiales bacterium]|nr:acyltransferase [Hyphomicrobiales bacterium]
MDISATSTAPPHGRNDPIDMLRGLSITLVVLFHIQLRMPFETTFVGRVLPGAIFNPIFRSGYYAVIVFFVISGFLITTSSLRRWGGLGGLRPGPFYLQRFARIAPSLAVLMILLAALHWAGVEGFVVTTTSLGRAVLAAATFHLNWLEADTGYLPGAWDVLWSLSVEEVFYLAFPPIVLLARGSRGFVAAMLVFVALGPFARACFTDNDIWADKSYLAGADAIALGCLAGLAAGTTRISRAMARTCLTCGLALFLFVFIGRRQTAALGLTALGLNVTVLAGGVALMLVGLRDRTFPPGSFAVWSSAPIRWFGRNSYEVYLSHMVVITLLAPLFAGAVRSGTAPFWAVGLVLLSGLAGHGLARGYSEPLNRAIRRRLAGPARTGSETSL